MASPGLLPLLPSHNTHILRHHVIICYMTYIMHQPARAARLVSGIRWLFVGPDEGT